MDNPIMPNVEKKQSFFHNTSKSLKATTIGFLVILLLIPMWMIEDLIRERQSTQNEAILEVSNKWSSSQRITGPILSINFTPPVIENGKITGSYNRYITLLPEELSIDGKLVTETRRRSIYEVNVYQSEIILAGIFTVDELSKKEKNLSYFHLNKVNLNVGISDLRGISEQITLKWNDTTYIFESGINGNEICDSGVSTWVDASTLTTGKITFEIKIKLKGSESISFTPVGKTTKVNLVADWNTPSFGGSYLPEKYEVTNTGFTAQWQVLHLNRSYPQLFDNTDNHIQQIFNSAFGVNLKVPVEQYQQSMRTAKYAILIIALTFIVIFFVEVMDKKQFHALQYLLVGLALCLFYTLLLSMSEHINFSISYLISALLTIGLISLYVLGSMKSKRPAFIIGGLLSLLYLYVYILIQLETLALLAGSLGLFVILAVLMYFSKKINWFSE